MKRFLLAVTLAAATTATPALAADVGISVSIGQPGFYGRLEIGDYPRPRLLYAEPVLVERVVVTRPPIYMRVPPGHARNWQKHCREYNACGERVYFVHDDWYEREYVPRYQKRHREERRDDHHGKSRDDGRGGNGKKEGKGHGRER